MRSALLATAAMNALGALRLHATGVRRSATSPRLPSGAHPAILSLIIGVFVLLFGVGLLWTGLTGRADPLSYAIAAAGKLACSALLTAFWPAGGFRCEAPLAAVGDLVFRTLFVAWLASDTD